MKQITNWQNATVGDLEADGLLDKATKLHVLSYQMQGKGVSSFSAKSQIDRILGFFKWHIDNKVPVVFHNGICFDIPLIEKLHGVDLSELMVIDTLAVSWYLNHARRQHGLDSFFEDYGIAKPKIDDWENLSYEEYRNRCEEDVKINKALWEDLKTRLIAMYTLAQEKIDAGLVGGKRLSKDEQIFLDKFKGDSPENAISRILTFLMFKMDCARLQEKTGWELDLELLEKSIKELSAELQVARDELQSVMPKIAKYSDRKAPAKPYKQNGELSASGEKWKEILDKFNSKELDEFGKPIVIQSNKEGYLSVLTGYEEPNANSTDQIKEFLYSKGWVPETFKYVKDKEAFQKWIESKPAEGSPRMFWSMWKEAKPVERKVPQVTLKGEDGNELCPSVERLAEDVPEIHYYSKYHVVKHRLGVLEGFKENQKDGRLQARINGFTNTLRVKHAEVVNLPGVDKPYGEIIRGVLIAGKGKVACGSDMSSLEDRVKHHFMLPHDPEYVATMQADDFDPHILMALTAGLVTQEEFDAFKSGNKTPKITKARKSGKATNYASVYNAAAAAIARAAGVSVEEGKVLHEAYWKLNWAVKAIAEEQVVIEADGSTWLINPINGFCYSLRKESDRFSTLCQGTGSFFFDMWVDATLEGQKKKWNKKSLTGSFHDESIVVHKDNPAIKEAMSEIISSAIDNVNETYKLRRLLGCETQFGFRYSEIH